MKFYQHYEIKKATKYRQENYLNFYIFNKILNILVYDIIYILYLQVDCR